MWDVIAEKGLYRLHGHKNNITEVIFLENTNALVSSSKGMTFFIITFFISFAIEFYSGGQKDFQYLFFVYSSFLDLLIKVWDLTTKHCVQTIVGHATEISSIAKNPTETRLLTLCSTKNINVYKILTQKQIDEKVSFFNT